MSTTDKLPAWPEPKDYTFAPEMIDFNGVRHSGEPYLDVGLYKSALADAWEARCREAVKALVCMSGMVHSIHQADIDETLSSIGPLPEESA